MGEAKRRAFYRAHQALIAEATAARIKRSEAAKKAAATRKTNKEATEARSAAAKKAAATRAEKRAETAKSHRADENGWNPRVAA